MNFSNSITKAPLPHDPARAQEIRDQFAGQDAKFINLLAGTAACSGYLSGLINREQAWLCDIADQTPEATLRACQEAMCGESSAQLSKNLRIQKNRAALLVALCDLGGVWELERVTQAISDTADCAVQAAISFLVAAEQARGKLPEVPLKDGGLFAIAMGKMGAGELNYSSDIDLIILFNESAYPAEDYGEIRRVFVRITQRIVKMLSDNTGDGYVYRTDLRLRPDPSVTPVCIGMAAAERYYEAQGRTWERSAMIKARVAAGDIASGQVFLDDLSPFIWRRHLDFAAVQDAYDMRLRIRKHKGLGGPLTLPGHNVKLGRGGIREIEFFVQTQQLIHGGRNEKLRDRRSLEALRAISDAGWVPDELQVELNDAYKEHRVLEHRLQMLEDAQTHIYPSEPDARLRMAHFCGFDDLEKFEEILLKRFSAVHALTEAFFAPLAKLAPQNVDLWCDFANPEAAREMAAEWQNIPALRSPRAGEIFARLEPKLAASLLDAPKPDEALVHLDVFLRGLPAGVQVFSLFEANPQILDLLVDICATAPRLAEYLGRNARVFDAVLSPQFAEEMIDADVLTAELTALLVREDDYESILDLSRLWMKEHKFRIGVQVLKRAKSPAIAAQEYSALAEATLRALWPAITANHARRFGAPPGQGASIVAMGKLGSNEMTENSDIDMIVVYDAPHDAMSDGAKPLPASTYYSKLTQALISALTSQTAQGMLYAVDMRLRPSGKQGPVATGLSAFRDYQLNEAWTWEHLALTRARAVAGPAALQTTLRTTISQVLACKRKPGKVMEDLKSMRAKLADVNAKAAADKWEMKLGPGRMLDIELLVQAGALINNICGVQSPRIICEKLGESGWLDGENSLTLIEALDLMAGVQQVQRLAQSGRFEPDETGRGLWQLLFDVTGTKDRDALQTALETAANDAALIIENRLQG